MSSRTAMCLVTTSRITTTPIRIQKVGALALLLSIFFALLARNTEPSVRQRIQPLEGDVLAAVVALAEGLRRAVQAPQRLVDVPEKSPFLAREEKRLLPLHGIGSLVSH